ncbi:dinuclear metal center protein, YbgI/SA1388 family [Flagellimonas taeanensis]|jgi:dinuclear metal center YbgI/SA1388 family protein|uniref:GTP cyclohydrolase 1 type 2 homolog n=1 Tax=Flagellimonas taeanensis TaxID=1005926 RepID=A0A1M6VV20_9FLAO|nr:Nif3-like dinuclear metal center hexameric protein [Allomuricauda taeanensis]SFC59312.1 dinuclear metal center protein, YbgI/SA1388 family [Allomuricauda taeanensis]SHK85392.1 dinuclear metal center protein, YbgI/SA1388 family [Allomuricauda taeanensis]
MTVQDITKILEELAPLAHAENFDNVGLLVGNPNMPVKGVLVTLDTLENVVDEAIEKQYNMIVSFHPIIFSGLKKLTGSTYVERVVMKAVTHNIAIYSMHTALDNSIMGVNAKICEVLDIKHPKILIPRKGAIKKLTTYAPLKDAEKVKDALFAVGAGEIGKYSNCSYSLEGTGSFKAGSNANPAVGKIGEVHFEKETQINVIYTFEKEKKILEALFEAHPYEEVAHEVVTLENTNQDMGMGMVGTLEHEMNERDFLLLVKERMGASVVRHTRLLGKKVRKVAVLGGSGAFAIAAAKRAGADVFITADIKYHQFFEAEDQIVIADIGHFETEQFTKDLLVDHLTKKIPNFAVALSESITNPIKYL